MKTNRIIQRNLAALALLSAFGLLPSALRGQGTAFSYQGRLNDGGSPATGIYDLRFAIYDSTNGPGTLIAGPLTNAATAVTNGLFTVTMDFGGGVFTGPNRCLEIAARTNGAATFTTLAPRQPVLPVPYAIMANSASNLLGTLPAVVALTNQLSAETSRAQSAETAEAAVRMAADSTLVVNISSEISRAEAAEALLAPKAGPTFTGTVTAGSFSGSGAGLTGISGTITWQNVTGTSQQAQPNTGYLANNAARVTITLPTAPNLGDIVRVSGVGAGGWTIAQNAGQTIWAGQFGGSYTNWNTLTNWTQTSAPLTNWNSVASSADGNKLAAAVVTSGGGIYTSTNAGGSWNLSSAPGNHWRAIASSADGTTLAAATTSYGIYTSTNSGANWSSSSLSADWVSIASSANGTRLAAVASGLWVATSTNSGATWTYNSAPAANWASIASSADGSKLAATTQSGIYTSTNSGVSWTLTSAPSTYWGAIASSVDGTKLAAVEDLNPGRLYTSADSGGTWTLTSAPTNTGGWMAIASSADGTKLLAAAWSSLYVSTDSGVTWALTSAQGPLWKSVAGSADGTKLAGVAGGGGIWTAHATIQTTTTPDTAGYLMGGQNSAIELQYIGNGQFMPLSYVGPISAF